MYCFCKIRCFLYFLRYRCIYIKSYFKIKTNRYINTKRVGILIDSIEKYIGLRYEEKLNLICDKLKKGIYNFGEFRL